MLGRKSRITNDQPTLEMTPMIDVVFQLLIFFIVTLKQEDILAMLSAARPAPDKLAKPDNQPDLINIEINRLGFVFRGRPVTREGLLSNIKSLSEFSKTANVIIRCTSDSPHKLLVQALDICNECKMTNLAIFSM
jgi:biopolymer transport protein ExbD